MTIRKRFYLKFSIVASLVFGSIYTSNAISSVEDNRYETYTGKVISIPESDENILKEIKIFGETHQDKTNLENIKSVGELHTDVNGNPILDRKGNKQYKVNIQSTNTNLFNKDLLLQGACNYGTVGGVPIYRPENQNRMTLIPKYAIPVNKKSTVIANSTKFRYAIAELSNGISLGDTGWVTGKTVLELDERTTHIALNIAKLDNSNLTKEDIELDDIMIYYEDRELKNETHYSIVNEVILPQQLQKVGEISDKLYWDESRKMYIIEKNIGELVLNGEEPWYIVSDPNYNSFVQYGFNDGYSFSPNTNILSSHFLELGTQTGVEYITIGVNSHNIPTLYIRILKDKLESFDLLGFKNWLKNNNVSVKYVLPNPEIIELKNMNISIPMQYGETNIFINSNEIVVPEIEITIDRIINIVKEAVKVAENNPTASNITNARYLVNLINDSILKDNLQNRLNKLFSSEITQTKKTVTSNIDVYIKSQNSLTMSLSTNYIIFDEFSGIDDIEKLNAVTINIDSSLPYQLNSYLESSIKNSDGSKIIPKELFNIRLNGENNYKAFSSINEKLILKDNCQKGNNEYGIDLILKGSQSHEADIYKTIVKFEVEQK